MACENRSSVSRVNPSGGQPDSERLVQAVAVATVRRLKRCARNHAGIEIHRVPGLVRQVSSLDNEILLKPPVTVKRCRSCLAVKGQVRWPSFESRR